MSDIQRYTVDPFEPGKLNPAEKGPVVAYDQHRLEIMRLEGDLNIARAYQANVIDNLRLRLISMGYEPTAVDIEMGLFDLRSGAK